MLWYYIDTWSNFVSTTNIHKILCRPINAQKRLQVIRNFDKVFNAEEISQFISGNDSDSSYSTPRECIIDGSKYWYIYNISNIVPNRYYSWHYSSRWKRTYVYMQVLLIDCLRIINLTYGILKDGLFVLESFSHLAHSGFSCTKIYTIYFDFGSKTCRTIIIFQQQTSDLLIKNIEFFDSKALIGFTASISLLCPKEFQKRVIMVLHDFLSFVGLC